jgi:hypothetical protein
MYWPRSRGETKSPRAAIAPVISPPAPSPWTARKAMSWSMVCESPDSAEPTRKTTMAIISHRFRPYMSPSLPYSGVVIVEAST